MCCTNVSASWTLPKRVKHLPWLRKGLISEGLLVELGYGAVRHGEGLEALDIDGPRQQTADVDPVQNEVGPARVARRLPGQHSATSKVHHS